LLQDGDKIVIDAEKGSIDVDLDAKTLEERKNAWRAKEPNFNSGTLWKYSQTVGTAKNGAVTHPGGSKEKSCYADI